MVFFLTFVLGLLASVINGFDIQAEIERAKNGGIVNIPTGTYIINEPLKIISANKLSIYGNGATILVSNNAKTKAVTIFSSTDVKIFNLKIDYNPLPFTQGLITKVAPDGSWLEVTIDNGYPTNANLFGTGSFVQIFEPNRSKFKQESSTVDGTQWSLQVANNIIRIGLRGDGNGEANWRNIRVNDVVAIGRPSGDFFCAIDMWDAKNTLLSSITIYSSNACGVLENAGSGTIIDNIQIKRGPKPVGATQPRLMSANRDGLHLNGPKGGTIIKNSFIEFIGDDAINIRSAFGRVEAINPNAKAITFSPGFCHFVSGDSLSIYDGYSLRRKGYVSVVSHNIGNTYAQLSSIDIIKVGDRIVSPEHVKGFKILNNTFRDIDARGIVAGGLDLYIEGNTIERTTIGGIWVGAELSYDFQEADFANNVFVRWNTLRDIGYTWRGRWPYQAFIGAINIGNAVPYDKVNQYKYVRQNSKVWIVENLVERSGLAAVFVAQTVGASICKNKLINTNYLNPNGAGTLWGVTSTSGMVIYDASNVKTYQNQVTLGPFAKSTRSVTDSDTVYEVTNNPC